MVRYLIMRSLNALLILWGVLSLTFLFMHLTPGDPSSLYVRPEIDPSVVENIRHQLGLDLPIWRQYLNWGYAFLQGNFGISFTQHRPVAEILREAIPHTLQLTLAVFLVQLFAGVLAGVMMAVKKGSVVDHGLGGVLLVFYSLPGFWLAIISIFIFSFKLGWLPSSHMQSFDVAGGALAALSDRLRHMILPVAVLSLPFLAATAKFVRNTFIDVLAQDYIRAARAFGLSPSRIYFKYALKNALLPLVSLSGLYVPFLLGGTVIIESVFSWPGMGQVTVEAILSRDFPVILAATFIAAASVIAGNFLSDIGYSLVDPRIAARRRAA